MTTVREYLDRNNQLDKAESVIDGFVNHSVALSDALDSHRLVVNGRAIGRLGAYSARLREIQIHSELLKPANAAKHIDTLLHETAHLIVHIVYPRASAHGREWKSVARKLGIAGNRVSKADILDDVRKSRANYIYACQNCGYEFHAQRRKKHHPSQYHHKDCGRRLGKLYLKRDNRTGQTFDAPTGTPATPKVPSATEYEAAHNARIAKAKLVYACCQCESEFPAARRKTKNLSTYGHKGCRGYGGIYLKRDDFGRKFPNPTKG